MTQRFRRKGNEKNIQYVISSDDEEDDTLNQDIRFIPKNSSNKLGSLKRKLCDNDDLGRTFKRRPLASLDQDNIVHSRQTSTKHQDNIYTSGEDNDEIDEIEEISEDEEDWIFERNIYKEEKLEFQKDHENYPKNHLPPNFYTDTPFDDSKLAFIGFFGADGVNSSNNDITGFTLRSTDFPFLQKLLIACGVQDPTFYFKASSSTKPVLLKAGLFGTVSWFFKDEEQAQDRRRLGLPSSKIFNTNIPYAKSFLGSLTLQQFLIVLLYWFAGDGHIKWEFCKDQGVDTLVKYQSLKWAARDKHITGIWSELLTENKFEGVKTAKSREIYVLTVPNTSTNNNLFLQTLNDLTSSNIPLHPKQLLLKEYLTAENCTIPNVFLSPRLVSFFGYLDEAHPNNRLACLMGQDSFKLDLFSLNTLTEIIGFPKCKTTAEFNVVSFIEKLELFANNNINPTKTQAQAIKYFNCLKKRLRDNMIMEDFQYKQKLSYKCNQCEQKCIRAIHLEEHIRAVHKNEKLYCSVPGCQYSCKWSRTMVHHNNITHSDNPVLYPCTEPSCNMTFRYPDNLYGHIRFVHKLGNFKPFPCTEPKCKSSFKRKSELNKHIRFVHKQGNFKPFPCTEPKCKSSFKRKADLNRHIRDIHKQGNGKSFPCTKPECKSSFSCQSYLTKHLTRVHKEGSASRQKAKL